MNVLFIIPTVYASYPGALVPHIGIGYALALLRKHGINAKVFDMRLGYNNDDLADIIESYQPDLIGLTAYSFSFDKTVKLMEFINKKRNCPLIIGGPHISAHKKELFNQVEFDFGITGEGEFPLLELCRALENKTTNLSEIKNLIWKNNGVVIENEIAPLRRDLDEIPFPDFEEFELEKYVFTKEKRIPITTSRGCPHSCTFCSVKLSMGKSFRPRSPENVVSELEKLYTKGWRYFDVVDDVFNMDLARAKKICDLIIEKNLKINWSLGNGMRADRTDEELLIKMKEAGCIFLAYGLESADDEVLKELKKGITVQRALEAFKLTKKVGIPFAVNFIIGNPGETYDKAMKSMHFAKYIPADYVNVYNIIPYPNTELFEWVEKNGTFLVDKKNYLENIATRVSEPIFETPQFTKKERRKALKIGSEIAKRSHLRYRFGPASILIWPIVKNDKIYFTARKIFMGNKIGRVIFNSIKKNKGHLK